MNKDNSLINIPLMAALASVLQIAEAFIPLPVPGMKFGFANLITLIALMTSGFRAGLCVAALRSLVSSLILGTFLSPGFMLSISGAVSSALVMGAVLALDSRRRAFGIIGVSVLGALAHNFAQLFVVSALFAGFGAVKWLAPWLLLSGVLTGYLTGFISIRVMERLKRRGKRTVINQQNTEYGIQESLERCGKRTVLNPVKAARGIRYTGSGTLKITFFFAAALFVLFSKNTIYYMPVLAVIIAGALSAKIPSQKLLISVKRLSFLLLFSFFVNAVSGVSAKGFGSLFIFTPEGLKAGFLVSLRLLTLGASAMLVMETTASKDLIEGLRVLMSPLKYVKIDPGLIAGNIALSLESVPYFAGYVKKRFGRLSSKRKRSMKHMMAFATLTLIAALEGEFVYAEAGE